MISLLFVGILLFATCTRPFAAAESPATSPATAASQAAADASVDYLAAWNRLHGEGVTPENNAAVVLLPFLRPGSSTSAALPKIVEALGVPPVKSVPWERFESAVHTGDIKREPGETDDLFFARTDRKNTITDSPWRARDCPDGYQWLQKNQAVIKAAVEASRRPRYFMPCVEPHPGDGLSGSMEYQFFSDRMNITRLLIKQAMLDAGEGRLDESEDLLLAVHRLARLFAQETSELSLLVAGAVDRRASEAERQMVLHESLGGARLRHFLQALSALPPFPRHADVLKTGEYLFLLDLLQSLKGPRAEQTLRALYDPFSNARRYDVSDLPKLDLSAMRAAADAYADRLVHTAQAPDYATRLALIDTLDAEVAEMKGPGNVDLLKAATTKRPVAVLEDFLRMRPGESVQDFSRRIAIWVARNDVGSIGQYLGVLDMIDVESTLTRTTFALGLYREKYKAYPRTLDGLVPEFLPAVPVDWFSGKPLVYRPGPPGVLYSVGRNARDDGAKDKEHHGDDMVVHLPPVGAGGN